MAMVSDIFEERVAAAMSASTGGCARDSHNALAHQCGSSSTAGSTRASSPDGLSSDCCGEASLSCPARAQCAEHTTLAQRRGLRAAILNDLGLDVESSTSSSAGGSPHISSPALTQTPASTNAGASRVHLTGTRPAPGPRAAMQDASQRKPPLPRGVGQPSPSMPLVNSRFSPNCLGSSPGHGGDASQRTPASRMASRPFQRAALTPTQAALQSPKCTILGTDGKRPTLVAGDATCRRSVVSLDMLVQPCKDEIVSEVIAKPEVEQTLQCTGFGTLSNEELAARLYAAAPLAYED